ncbi:heterokaryon incompatibility [Apiospora sp. TS-2023a]
MDTEDVMDYCEVCVSVAQQLRQLLENRRGHKLAFSKSVINIFIASFGTVERIVTNNGCLACKYLQREIYQWEREYSWTRSDDLNIVLIPGYYKYELQLSLETLKRDEDNHLIYPCRSQRLKFHLYPTEPSNDEDILGRVFNEERIDMGLIHGWAQCCEDTHMDTCTSKLSPHMEYCSPLKQMLFIDTEDKCLVYGSLDDKYIALSYVWGQVATVRTTVSGLSRMTKPGAIEYDIRTPDFPLPETVRDIMRLACLLGVRYAWVDALCIVQYAPDKADQLNAMASIYAGAYLTVISEGNDAGFGLPGIGSGARARSRPCRQLPLPGMTLMVDESTEDEDIIPMKAPGTWETRGWTLQEAVFSRRALTFHHNGIVSWRCKKCLWLETKIKPSERLEWAEQNREYVLKDWRYFGLGGINDDGLDIRRWCGLAEEYFSRRLTYDCDAVNALAGIISVISRLSPGGLVWGLPAYYFDIFLLWDIECAEGDQMPQRRDDSASIPTWSFLGWKGGRLDTRWWRFSMDRTLGIGAWSVKQRTSQYVSVTTSTPTGRNHCLTLIPIPAFRDEDWLT